MALEFPRIIGIAALGMLLASCSSTKFLDAEGISDEPVQATPVYNPTVVEASESLYGEEDTLDEDSPKLKEAAKIQPELIYNIVYFDYDSDDVLSDALDTLKLHAEYLLGNTGVRFVLEGHADERGSSDYNIGLAERRAQAVMKVLLGYGAPRDRMSVVSYGEERPAVEGDTEEAFSKNRRVEIIYK